ncbi:DUF4375 domain-containing protein [Bernardetia sp. OM2101]|uniref:DMP19 family protein n=1 Tax=Bernardetia sp. OM2101 TaxID=3344876 RepID=UPI0035D098B7
MDIVEEYYFEATKNITEEILKDHNQWYDYVLKLEKKLQVTYTIVIFHEQVFNGGIDQYYVNSYGIFSSITIDNLRYIGSAKEADILEEVFLKLRKNYSDKEFINKLFWSDLNEIYEKEWEDFAEAKTEQYYELSEANHIYDNLEKYLTDK